MLSLPKFTSSSVRPLSRSSEPSTASPARERFKSDTDIPPDKDVSSFATRSPLALLRSTERVLALTVPIGFQLPLKSIDKSKVSLAELPEPLRTNLPLAPAAAREKPGSGLQFRLDADTPSVTLTRFDCE